MRKNGPKYSNKTLLRLTFYLFQKLIRFTVFYSFNIKILC